LSQSGYPGTIQKICGSGGGRSAGVAGATV